MITLPTGMALNDWADQITFELGSFGLTPQLEGEDWVSWGQSLRSNLSIGHNLPDPASFTEWPEWAQRFCEVFA